LLTSSESGVANPVTTYSYDAAGNRTLLNVNGAVTTYTWDYENRMASASQPGGVSVTNTYLPNNRIVRAADAFGNLTTLTYDASGASLATERYTQASKDFGGLLAQVSTANPSPRYYIADLATNIAVLANGSTVSELYLPQAFGLALPGSTPPTTQPYGFQGDAGAYNDPITGLVVMWNRAYDPNIGQFLNPDPTGIRGGDPNYRQFVLNNPVRWTDPRGLGSFPNLCCWPRAWPCCSKETEGPGKYGTDYIKSQIETVLEQLDCEHLAQNIEIVSDLNNAMKCVDKDKFKAVIYVIRQAASNAGGQSEGWGQEVCFKMLEWSKDCAPDSQYIDLMYLAVSYACALAG
jgi:RHS repeat-associated protein